MDSLVVRLILALILGAIVYWVLSLAPIPLFVAALIALAVGLLVFFGWGSYRGGRVP
jgi:hypothetical protein